MARALGFIGGGLLSGIGEGLVEAGEAKRERTLEEFEQKNRIERDERKMEGKAKFERALVGLKHKNALALKLARGAPTTPTGYQRTEGGLEFTSGGPADPKQVGALATAKRDPDGGVTPAQQANNAEIDAARDTLGQMGLDKAEITRRTQKATNTGRENRDYDPSLERLVRAATQRKVGNDPKFNLIHRRYLGPPPEFTDPAGPKALPSGVSAEQPDVFDRIGNFFSGDGDAPAPASGAAPRRGRPRGGRPGTRGRGGARDITAMSITELDDLMNERGDSLSPADLKAIQARLAELGI